MERYGPPGTASILTPVVVPSIPWSTATRSQRRGSVAPHVVLALAVTNLLVAVVALATISPPAQADVTPQPLAASPTRVDLGDVSAGSDRSSLSADPLAPGGPTIRPDASLYVEPGATVDGVVVPIANSVTDGKGAVEAEVPRTGNIAPTDVSVEATGRVTARVTQEEF